MSTSELMVTFIFGNLKLSSKQRRAESRLHWHDRFPVTVEFATASSLKSFVMSAFPQTLRNSPQIISGETSIYHETFKTSEALRLQ